MKRFAAKLLFPAYRHPRITAAAVLVSALAAIWVLLTFPFENDISRMLPDGSESLRCYSRIIKSSMFNKAPLLFHTEDPERFRTPEFSAKLSALAADLKTDPRILRVDWKLMESSPGKAVESLVPYIPQYLPCTEMDPEQLVDFCRKQFLLPSSAGQAAMLTADPFRLASRLLLRLEHFRQVSHFCIGLDSPFLVSPDGRSLLVVLETTVSAADPNAGRALLSMAESKVRAAGFVPGKDVDLLFPHRRAIANETIMKRDIFLVSILSVVIFTVLIIFIYRCDIRSFLIPAIPFLSALLTAGLMPLVFSKPLFFVVGMGGIVISLALDYGIHIYAVMTDRGRFHSLLQLLPPLGIAALTSCMAFFLFLFSRTDAIRQLGFFSGFSLLLGLLLMLLILPPALARSRSKTGQQEKRIPAFPVWIVRTVWVALLLFSLAELPGVRLHSDVRQFDLSPAEYDRQDARLIQDFQEGTAPAMTLFSGRTANEALTAAAAVSDLSCASDCFSAAELYPPAAVREKYWKTWRSFEKERWPAFCRKLKEAAEKAGFEPGFFDTFLKQLHDGILHPPAEPPPCFLPVLNRLLVRGSDGTWNAAVLGPDRESIRRSLSPLPGAVVISRGHFAHILARDIVMGLLPLALGAFLSVTVLTFLYFRSVSRMFPALIPVFTSLLFIPAFFSCIGKAINLPVLMAGIILCGLAVDYGIFAVHAIQTNQQDRIFRAVTLSALTTAAGGLTVAFTAHPMLRDAGQTLITGILFAWFTALFLLPSFCGKKTIKHGLLLLLLPVFLFFSGCRTAPFERVELPPVQEVMASPTRIPFPENFTFSGSVVLEIPFFSMDFLCLAERTGGEFRIAGLNPAGMKILEVTGRNGKVTRSFFLPGTIPGDPEQNAAALLRQFETVFSGLGPCPEPVLKTLSVSPECTVLEKNGTVWGGRNLDVIRKEHVDYYQYRNVGIYRFPVEIVYHQGFWFPYRLIFRIREVGTD